MAAPDKPDRWTPSKLLSCASAPRISGLLCRASVLCCGSGYPVGRTGYGSTGSRFEQEVVELEESPWKMREARGEHDVFMSMNGNESRFLGRLLHLKGVTDDERWEVYRTLKKYQNQLKHEYIVPIKDLVYDRSEDRLIVITEYCEGGNVHSLLAHARKYDEMLNDVEVQDWLVQLLLALEHLEEQNIVHGQINCQEVLLKNNAIRLRAPAEVKRIYKRYAAPPQDGNKSHVCSRDFDISYVAPEILVGESYTAKSDVWSVGCVLYEMCTKKRLFSGGSTEELKANMTSGRTQRLPSWFPYELQEILNILLTTDPIYRPGPSAALQLPYLLEHLEDMEVSNSLRAPPFCVSSDPEVSVTRYESFVQNTKLPIPRQELDTINNNNSSSPAEVHVTGSSSAQNLN